MVQRAVRETAAEHTPTSSATTERQGNETVKYLYSVAAGKEIPYKISDYRSFFITFAFGLGRPSPRHIRKERSVMLIL